MLNPQPWRTGIGSLIVLIHGMLTVAAWHAEPSPAHLALHRQPALQVQLLSGADGRLQLPPQSLKNRPPVAAPAWQVLTIPDLRLAVGADPAAPAVRDAATPAVASSAQAAPSQTPVTSVSPLPTRAPTPPNPASVPADFTPAQRAAHADHRHCPPAPYPPALRERGIEGAVKLRVRVDTQGQAADVHVLASSGFRLFDEAALRQVRSCRFQPAMRGDAALESWVEFPVRFALHTG
jgi:protein TonB